MFIFFFLGVSAFAGVAVLVSMIPLNAFVVGRQKMLQEGQMKKKDHRVKLMNEVLNGIRVSRILKHLSIKSSQHQPNFAEFGKICAPLTL